MLWGSYFEKTLETKSKKKRKDKKKATVAEEEESNALDAFKPKFFDLLPFVLARGSWLLIGELKSHLQESLNKPKEVDESQEESEEVVRSKRVTVEPVIYEMASDVKAVSTNDAKMEEKYLIEKIQNSVAKEISTKGQKWSKEEISKLIKMSTTKYPVGSTNRWQNLARELNRSVDDITSTIEKLRRKEETYSLESLQSQTKKADLSNQTKKADLSKSLDDATPAPQKAELEWTQNEQKLLETALQHFPKGTPERWEKVASCVPNKTPAQCMDRFKQLAEMVRQRKLQQQSAK
uniref:DnaJ homolog subfamily C member 2 n=1 Tax=Steinernema glaseri TaxID=37863 RepID=A0A1I7Z755_9BILA